MGLVNWAGPVSEILAHPLIPLKKFQLVHINGWSGLVPEISVFPTNISGTGPEIFAISTLQPSYIAFW